MRAYPHLRERFRDAFAFARKMPIEIADVKYPEVVGLAMKTGLTSYDACYLWLAREVRGELITEVS
jgi:predicted nucleic acid-binding protein